MDPGSGVAVVPPIEPMLAKLADALPAGGPFLYEPKWDGFRAIIFRGRDDVYIQSRDLKPLDRYFPDVHDAVLAQVPPGIVVDGEIVIATPGGLDFDALQLRLHPAASRDRKARAGDAGVVCRLRSARHRGAGRAATSRNRSGAACLRGRSAACGRRST